MENEKKTENDRNTARIFELQDSLLLASHGLDPSWTRERIKSVLAKERDGSEILDAISALIRRQMTSCAVAGALPTMEDRDRSHAMGGFYYLNALLEEIRQLQSEGRVGLLRKFIGKK